MSKYIKIDNGDFKVSVKDNHKVIFDTENAVEIIGDLIVTGTTTTIDSQNLAIEDNLIEINKGETGSGVTGTIGERYAGVSIDRGTLTNVLWVFDETETWYDPNTATIQSGAWVPKYPDGTIIGIKTTSINTNGSDLSLIGGGNGVVTVTGTNDYETNVTDDDHIPNKKYVDDAIINVLLNVFQDKIEENNTSIEVQDFETTGNDSKIIFTIDGIQVAGINQETFDIHGIRITGSEIESTESNGNLVLNAPGTGTVQIKDVLEISKTPNQDDPRLDPDAPVDGVRIYSKLPSDGGTGIYFKNEEDVGGELVSKSRALLFSLMF